jgi:hypothetical protein
VASQILFGPEKRETVGLACLRSSTDEALSVVGKVSAAKERGKGNPDHRSSSGTVVLTATAHRIFFLAGISNLEGKAT